MDVISSVKSCLSSWDSDGHAECRSIVTPLHCHPTDLECIDVLTTAYQTLLCSALSSWSCGPDHLTASAFVKFVQDVLAGLPSTSSTSSSTNVANAAQFGELLIDLFWAVDCELDDIVADAKLILSTTTEQDSNVTSSGVTEEDATTTSIDPEKSDSLKKSTNAKENAERDKEVLADILKELLNARIVYPDHCRERLDINILTAAGLIPDKSSFEKKEIRTRTSIFYKQNKFNLLREQSEGYTKLTVDLIGNLGPPHSPSNGYPAESSYALESRARSSWERVLSLIGYFDLDPNRALDIVLDVFSTNLATHYRFFLTLLSFSPWAEILRKPAGYIDEDVKMTVDRDPKQYYGKDFDTILQMAESEGRRSSVPQNLDIKQRTLLAQVLGFKFHHYQSPDVQESCPKSLFLTTALLIREQCLTIEDLYPHLTPSDEEMETFHKIYLDKVKERISSSSDNLLAMAAPLESRPNNDSKTRTSNEANETKKAPESNEPQNQKAMMVIALLSIGCLRPALSVLSKFPWFVDAHPEIADLVLRIMKISISPLYDAHFGKERNMSFLEPRLRYSASGLVPPPPRKYQLTICAPTPPSTHTHEFTFFFPHWADFIPLCSSLEDLVNVIEPFMAFIGLHVSREPLFLTKFLRVGKVHLLSSIPVDPDTKKQTIVTEPDNAVQMFWLKVARKYLLPAMCMISGNAVCSVEIWNVLKQFDTTIRWRLYGEWRDVTYQSHPELRAQQVLRDRESKGVLRRLSSQTIDSLAGTVAKLAHSNPCIFFTHAVHQIQAYDNLADVVIQALRYATNMGFDILVFIILDALANPDKDRVKDDGVYTSDWLQSLAAFTGSLFRRYASDLTPLIKYIVHQLYYGQTSEIVVLEKLILRMAGIEPLPSLSDSQIAAMAGGPTLRIETVASDIRGAGFDVTEATLKGAPRLGRALMETKLALPLLIQVAQQRQACVFKVKEGHLKSLGFLYDATHGVLLQYLDLLTTKSVISLEEYRSFIPSLSDLVMLYGISAGIALHLTRPLLSEAVEKHALEWAAKRSVEKIESGEAAEKRLKAALAAKRDPTAAQAEMDATPTPNDTEQIKQDVIPDSVTESVKILEPFGQDTEPQSPWIPELTKVFEECKAIAPGNACEVIGPAFYLTFWQLSSYDILFPKDKYEEAEKALNAASEVHHGKYRQAERAFDKTIRQSALTHRNQRDRYLSTAAELKKERDIHESVYSFTSERGGRLDREKFHWFTHVIATGKPGAFVAAFIEHCIIPRCLISPMDADFCARFIMAMHLRGTPGFPTLVCYDKLIGEHVKIIIFSCSENEARNYGRFLKGVLQDLFKWHGDEKLYNESNRHEEGSKVVVSPGFRHRWSNALEVRPEEVLQWPAFKSFLRKCHRKLKTCFMDCLVAKDFMHVYNALLVLKEILDVFPMASVNELVGPSLDQEVQRLTQVEERGDLKILARAYYAGLKKREASWAGPETLSKPGPPAVAKPPSTGSQQESSEQSREKVGNMQGNERVNGTVPSIPRAPKSDNLPPPGNAPAASTDRPNSTKLALHSIPRPEVVKRIRPENKTTDSAGVEAIRPNDLDRLQKHAEQIEGRNNAVLSQRDEQVASLIENSRHSATNNVSRPSTPNLSSNTKDHEISQIPRTTNGTSSVDMPPPSHAMNRANAGSRDDQRSSILQSDFAPQSVPPRTPSSPATRPGTRNVSADSRASVTMDDVRSGRADHDDDRRAHSDLQSRADRGHTGHRDVIHGRSERNGRDRREPPREREAEHERDAERDKERQRDREREKDRERERERERDRERDRERPRERERERDKDRERDRHRREEKDREREQRKDRDAQIRSSTSASRNLIVDEQSLSTRPDASRHRVSHSVNGDDTLGKRRRPADDDPERGSKRGSRREGYREEKADRTDRRRPSEKDGREHIRDGETKRRDREGLEIDTNFRERSPDRARAGERPVPSAPRAMASTPVSATSPRLGRPESIPGRDRDWKGQRDFPPPSTGNSPVIPTPSTSLRSRISDKDVPYTQSPNEFSNRAYGPDRRGESFTSRDSLDPKKRLTSERDMERSESLPNIELAPQSTKRPKLSRNRDISAITRRVVIENQANDRNDRSSGRA